MGWLRPSVEIVTPVHPARMGNIQWCHQAVLEQTYSQDFGGTILHTVIVDGMQPIDHGVRPDMHWFWLRDGPHDDHGTAAIQFGMNNVICDLVMQLADDEILDKHCIYQLVSALQAAHADFAMCWRDWPQRPGVMVTGDPPIASNLTTGLFKPSWWKAADMVSGPSGLYTQPGADGQCAWDWLQRGAELVIVPQVLSHVEAILPPVAAAAVS